MMALVGDEHLTHARTTARTFVADDEHITGRARGRRGSPAWRASSSPSKTRARPSKRSPSLPVTLATAPRGRGSRTARPDGCLSSGGFDSGRTISWPLIYMGTSFRFSFRVRPVTLMHSPCNRPPSSSIFIKRLDAADRDEFRHQVAPARAQVREHRGALADASEVIEAQAHASAACAIASRCSTALVEPPRAITTRMAFSKERRVRMSRGFKPAFTRRTTASPAR